MFKSIFTFFTSPSYSSPEDREYIAECLEDHRRRQEYHTAMIRMLEVRLKRAQNQYLKNASNADAGR